MYYSTLGVLYQLPLHVDFYHSHIALSLMFSSCSCTHIKNTTW